MATRPVLPDGEDPLDTGTLDAFLSSMGTDMVLVGGQALGFWMERFAIRYTGTVITNDGDALGGIQKARDIAAALKAALVIPDKRALTALVAQIRIPARGSKIKNIDVLHLLFTVGGLRKSNEFTKKVIGRSIEVEWRPKHFIRVMHPMDVLESRVHNAAGLLEHKGEHVLTQARWSIEVARAAMLRVLRSPEQGDDRIGQMVQAVFRLAHSQAGRTIHTGHGIDVLDAIPVSEIRSAEPSAEEQLSRVDDALAKRARFLEAQRK